MKRAVWFLLAALPLLQGLPHSASASVFVLCVVDIAGDLLIRLKKEKEDPGR